MSKRHLSSLLAATAVAALLALLPVASVGQSNAKADAKTGKGKTGQKENAADFQSAATPHLPAPRPRCPTGSPIFPASGPRA